MKATDITGLVKGLLVVIGLAISVGRYDDLRKFARNQAIESLKGWKSTPFFYPASKSHGANKKRAEQAKKRIEHF